MLVNNARSVSEALSNGLHAIRVQGIKQESRVGDVLVHPMPVMTVYHNPLNRVLFSPMRDANPFFHVMESLWMLAGRNDLPWLTRFNKKFSAYSDDGGQTQPGAYGYRWRNYFGWDQLKFIAEELKKNPQTRRCVLAMWDGGSSNFYGGGSVIFDPGDFGKAVNGSADVPCNTHAYFDTINGRLNMTVCCRSNDIIWGAYGANAVHFSFLLEYLSVMTGIPMGQYRQFSNNFHLYTNVVSQEQLMPMARDVGATDRYLTSSYGMDKQLISPDLRRVPLIHPDRIDDWHSDLDMFMADEDMEGSYRTAFFADVAVPMYEAYIQGFKNKDYYYALDRASHIRAEDWRIACREWLDRRRVRAETNQQPFTEVVGHGVTMQEDNVFGVETRSE